MISVFARLGGGIYTKAADVGADLVGKIENTLDEDDPRNPATIADNVGDNVGDCAGMAADVFETYAVSLIGAILVGALTLAATPAAIVYPFVLGGHLRPRRDLRDHLCQPERRQTRHDPDGRRHGERRRLGRALLAGDAYSFPGWRRDRRRPRTANDLYFASLVGLLMTGIVVVITNYYTSMSYGPVRKIAKASETGHATNIIAGLAIGQHATALPVGFIGLAILFSFHFAGSLRHRDRGHEHAFDGRNHHLARRFWSDHG